MLGDRARLQRVSTPAFAAARTHRDGRIIGWIRCEGVAES